MKTSVKMDVDSVDNVDSRRPRLTVDQLENFSLVDVDNENLSLVDVNQYYKNPKQVFIAKVPQKVKILKKKNLYFQIHCQPRKVQSG